MPGFIDTIYSRFVRPNAFMITVIIAAAVFIWAAYYAYVNFFKDKPDDMKYKDIANVSPNGETITIYMFHVDWCPHCKVALPEWKRFAEEFNEKMMNGYVLSCQNIDCTDDADPQVNMYMEKYSVDSYPTIKAIMNDEEGKEIQIAFDAKASFENLEKFANAVSLGNNTGL